ncbi:Ap-2 complex subunit alpha, partial [Globisporangium splendens]
MELFKKCMSNMNVEIQQRACEYLALHHVSDELMKRVLEPMPIFPENRESALIVRLRNQQKATAGEEGEPVEDPADSGGAKNEDSRQLSDSCSDLLSLDDSPPKKSGFSDFGSSADAIRGANPVSELVDVFGSLSTPPPAPVGGVIGMDASLVPKLAEWSRNLMLNPQGVLFENDVLQIGAKHEYRGSQGRIQFFFGNKTNDAIGNFQVQIAVANDASFRMQCEDVPTSIGSKQQVKQQVMIECMAPFVAPPTVHVRFSMRGGNYAYPLSLPCPVTSFMEPVKLSAEDFMKCWSALEDHDREAQDVVTSAAKMDPAQTRKWCTEQLKFALAEVRYMRLTLDSNPLIDEVALCIVQGVDTSEATLSLACTFRTDTSGPNGDKVSVGCLVRIETNAMTNAYRITVRAVHKDVSEATKNCLKTVLA